MSLKRSGTPDSPNRSSTDDTQDRRESTDSKDSRIEVKYPWQLQQDPVKPADLIQKHAHKLKKEYREACATYGWLDWLQSDLVAGISVGFMVVPQGMSYAGLAGLPSVFGLYGAFLPCIIYTLVGSSKQLAVGPVAVTSLIISANLQRILPCANGIDNPNEPPPELEACQEQYNRAAIQLAFIVAMLYTGVGILRLGWITKFLSHAVISGFTTGAAVTIGMGQVKYLLGYKVDMGHSTTLQDYLTHYIEGESPRYWKPFRYIRSFGPLFLCIIGICGVVIGHIDEPSRGSIRTVGYIPAGLPGITISWWSPMNDPSFTDLISTAIIVMIVDLLESTSIARALARKNGYELSYNREIIGLGLANLVGAAFNSYTTTGSFSRSAVNDLSGAKTPLAQTFCGVLVMFVLLFLTGVFAKLPFNVLAAIVIVSVAGLFEFEQAIFLWKVNKLDLCCWSIKQYPDAKLVPGILAFRIDAPVYFANAKTLEDKIEKAMTKYTAWSQIQGVQKLYFLIIDLTPVHHLDSMGLHFLEDMIFNAKRRGCQLILANPSESVSQDWQVVRLPDLIGHENIFVGMHDAFMYAQNRLPQLGVDVHQVTLASMPVVDICIEKGHEPSHMYSNSLSTLRNGSQRDRSLDVPLMAEFQVANEMGIPSGVLSVQGTMSTKADAPGGSAQVYVWRSYWALHRGYCQCKGLCQLRLMPLGALPKSTGGEAIGHSIGGIVSARDYVN
eukprot:gene18758-25290_t